MKKISDDLEITGIDISIAGLGATVDFKYLGEYVAQGYYERHSSGYRWLESVEPSKRSQMDMELCVEEHEEAILEWVEEQFQLEATPQKLIS